MPIRLSPRPIDNTGLTGSAHTFGKMAALQVLQSGLMNRSNIESPKRIPPDLQADPGVILQW